MLGEKMLGKLPLGAVAAEDEDLATRVLIMLVIFAVSLVGEYLPMEAIVDEL